MKKECKIILLPTKEESNIHLEQDGVIEYYKNSLPNIKADPQHLYILSDDEIKEGDWVLCSMSTGPTKALKGENYKGKEWKKVIATTDPSLSQSQYTKEELDGHEPIKFGLPLISQSDIEYIISLYNEDKNDTVMVEYESEGLPSKQIKIGDVDLTEFNDNPYKPKLKDNCIIIQKSC